jgi:hypothetical protein
MKLAHVGLLLVSLTAVAVPLRAQDLSAYRTVHLGERVQAVLASTGIPDTDVKIRHQRPALMQDLEWALGGFGTSAATTIDPVRLVLFNFYNDQLYRVSVSYDRTRIEGLTDADLIESLSAVYGTALISAGDKVSRAMESPDTGQRQQDVVARWEDADYSIVLVRGGYLEPLSLVMLDKHLANDARYADAEARRLDIAERSTTEAARQRRDAEASLRAQEKARPANKAAFRP